MPKARLNWPIASVATAIGVGVITAGLRIDEWSHHAVASVLINAGVSIGLLVVIVVLQRRVVHDAVNVARDVAETTATAAAARATDGLRERVTRLENLDEAQAAESERRRADDHATVRRLLSDDLNVEAVGELLVAAIEEHIIDGDNFRVRTSAEPASHVLHILPFLAAGQVTFTYLDFQPFTFENGPVVVDGRQLPAPDRNDSTVLWHLQDAGEVAAELEAGLRRRNLPLHGFKLAHALRQLAASVSVMREARLAPADSPKRLNGKLQLLVNAHWALTTFGLEAVNQALAFEVKVDLNPSDRYFGPTLFVPDAPVYSDGWSESVTWMTSRENMPIQDREPPPGSYSTVPGFA